LDHDEAGEIFRAGNTFNAFTTFYLGSWEKRRSPC
jgi:hypothetical protein